MPCSVDFQYGCAEEPKSLLNMAHKYSPGDRCRILIIAQNVADLGIKVGCDLKYDIHVNNDIGEDHDRVGFLFESCASHSLHIRRQAYVTYVWPVLDYASGVCCWRVGK